MRRHTTYHPSAVFCSFILICLIALCPSVADAQVYNWQTGEVIPGTESIVPGPQMSLWQWNTEDRNLRYADFSGGLDLAMSHFVGSWLDYADFSDAHLSNNFFQEASLRNANLSGATINNVYFDYADLTNVNFSGAELVCVSFNNTKSNGITKEQIYSTKSYQEGNLQHLAFSYNDLSGWNLANQNLQWTTFFQCNLTGVDFSGAGISGVEFTGAQGFTKNQLYSTKSYINGDLQYICLDRHDISNGDFANQDMSWARLDGADFSGADFSGATLVSARFTEAKLQNANFSNAIIDNVGFNNTTANGFSKEQLSSTASYNSKKMHGVNLGENDLSGWDFSGQDITRAWFNSSVLVGADFDDAIVKGARFEDTTSKGFTKEQLYATASYREGDLWGIGLQSNDLSGWNLSGKELQDTDFSSSILTGTDISESEIDGACFNSTTSKGFSKEQLYSTKSYKNGKLSFIRLSDNDLTGWCFAGQELYASFFERSVLQGADLSDADIQGARFDGADLTNADLSRADLRRAMDVDFASAITNNTILPDGSIHGLNLKTGEILTIRDSYVGIPVLIDDQMVIAEGAILDILMQYEEWGSTIKLQNGFVPDLGGTLRLHILPFWRGIEYMAGTTFDLFDWNGMLPEGETFDEVVWEAGYQWDISQLYTTGEVTLLAIPEPCSLMLLLWGGAVCLVYRRK